MAENESAGERTEQPTPKRLADARKQGNIPRSRELATAAVFAAGVMALLGFGPAMARAALRWMRAALTPDVQLLGAPQDLFAHTGHLLLRLFAVIAPLLVICLIAGLAAPLVMGSLKVSSKALAPDLKRLNPLAGIKRLYGMQALAELVKSLLRVALVGSAAGLCLWQGLRQLLPVLNQALEPAIAHALGFTMTLLVSTAAALAVLALLDAPYQWWNWKRKLKMTRQELRDELKDSEGKPEVKSRIRQIMQQMAQRRMMDAVPTADVIVVNPTHYAVALKYAGESMRAPTLVAKGADEIAARIRAVGERHQIAIVHAPPLARALYREADVGQEIPARLYIAVAQVLSYVYQLRAWVPGRGGAPMLPEIALDEQPHAGHGLHARN